MATFRTTTLTFYDATHTQATGPRIYWTGGKPGQISNPIDQAILPKVGEVYGFFLHRGLQTVGTNTIYAVSGIFFGRIMKCDVTGGPNAPGLVVQPVSAHRQLGHHLPGRPFIQRYRRASQPGPIDPVTPRAEQISFLLARPGNARPPGSEEGGVLQLLPPI